MLVVLDLSASRCIKHGVQFCCDPEGFLSIKETHPEDTFCFADEESKQSFNAIDMLANGWQVKEARRRPRITKAKTPRMVEVALFGGKVRMTFQEYQQHGQGLKVLMEIF